MTELEASKWKCGRGNLAAVLLGLVVDGLGTFLAKADWTHGWIGVGDTVRLEWAGGPTVAAVIDYLMPAVFEGELCGIPGLRRGRVEESSATLIWLAASPTRLHLTWLPAPGSAAAAG